MFMSTTLTVDTLCCVTQCYHYTPEDYPQQKDYVIFVYCQHCQLELVKSKKKCTL